MSSDDFVMERFSYVELRNILLSAIVLTSIWRCGKSEPSSRIILPQGPITGIRIFSGSRSRVNAYLGIPYALPPTGDLRFAAPARHPGWNTTLFAGHFRPDCPQLQQDDQGIHTDEDCLYLNLFVPEVDTPYRNLPVAIFLHGIDYVSGSPLVIAPEELASEGLIIVTVSYRLNVFGFLGFEDDFARGNLGILDQYMALVWVRENIKYIGGSPDNITLIGHGSGASSILVHLTSPRTKNLFQRVVLMSGSVFSPWLRSRLKTDSRSVLTVSRSIARSLGCYGENFPVRSSRMSSAVLSCMRKKSKDEILRAFQSAYKNGNWTDVLGPMADDFLPSENQYLPNDPVLALKQGKFHKMPILAGITPNEGTLTIYKWRDLISGREEDIKYFVETTAITDVIHKYNLTFAEIRSLVKWHYFEKNESGQSVLLQLVKLYNDAMYTAPFIEQLRVLSGQSSPSLPIFVYHFTYATSEYLGNIGQMLNLSEASHGAELSILFGPSLFQKVSGRRFTTGEERLSIKMKRLWASFIRTGNPNPAPYALSIWEKYSLREPNYLKMFVDGNTGENLRKMTGSFNSEADSLWNTLLPKIGNLTRERHRKREIVYTGGTSLDSSSTCNSYRNAMFTILAFSVILLFILLLSLLLLKKRTKERDRNIL